MKMGCRLKNRGFSLTEVLLSVGVLAIGMIFIAGVFPVGIHYTTIAIEQTKAAIIADEAFAKVRLYAVGDPCDSGDGVRFSQLADDRLEDFNNTSIFPATDKIDLGEFTYPSASSDISQKRYCWSALCRLTSKYDSVSNPKPDVEVTVFVCRKTGPNLLYPKPPNGTGTISWPRPIRIGVSDRGGRNLQITDNDEKRFITDGCTIVDGNTGRRYRVLERYANNDDTVLLDGAWEGGGDAWVVPPPVNGGRNPCIAVYQREIQF